MSAPIPDGFTPHTRLSPATAAWTPILARTTTGVFELGLVVADAHCNSRGRLHGGVIATLADNACGLSLGLALGPRPDGIVTTRLAVDYIAPARPGQWLQITPRVVKAGRASGVVDALVTADGAVIARVDASFRVIAAGRPGD